MSTPRSGAIEDFGILGSDPADPELLYGDHSTHGADVVGYLRPDICETCARVIARLTA